MTNPAPRIGLWILLSAACSPGALDPESSPAAREVRESVAGGEAAEIGSAIRSLLAHQTAAWNEGDLAAFVAFYLDSPRMRFVSGGSVRYGMEDVLERYRRNYPGPAAMGRLRFTDLDVRVLSEGFVFVFGRYRLAREGDAPTGLFTLLFERTPDGWKIVHDHTSTD